MYVTQVHSKNNLDEVADIYAIDSRLKVARQNKIRKLKSHLQFHCGFGKLKTIFL